MCQRPQTTQSTLKCATCGHDPLTNARQDSQLIAGLAAAGERASSRLTALAGRRIQIHNGPRDTG